MTIADKTLLVTGASRGIGRALVAEALRRGARRVYAGTRGPLQTEDERVTAVTLDVTDTAQIERAAREIDALDVLFNNAGVSFADDLGKRDVIRQHLDVNLFGVLDVTRAFLPLLKRSRGAVVNTLSLAAIAAVPILPAYSVSKAAAASLTQSLRAFLARDGVTVHAAFLGPVDTDMTRGLELPKVSADFVARGILDGLENGDEDIFPDPASQPLATSWRSGASKTLERGFSGLLSMSAASAAA